MNEVCFPSFQPKGCFNDKDSNVCIWICDFFIVRKGDIDSSEGKEWFLKIIVMRIEGNCGGV